MPLKIISIQLNDPIFDKSKRDGIVSRGLTRIAKRFKKLVVDTQVYTQAKGINYSRRSGVGFTRDHRASAKGDPPAPDTMNLVRSVEDNKTSPTSHETFVNDAKAPYGKHLVKPRLNRPIMGEDLIRKFEQTDLREENDRMGRELTGGI